MFELEPLAYDMSALEPYISAETFNFHYNKHYKGYVDKLNELIKGSIYEPMSLADIVKESFKHPQDRGIYNNAGQVWNHQFFWQSLTPNGGGEPSGERLRQIIKSFGGYADFRQQFVAKAVSQFGSGWCWLINKKDGALEIVSTANADNPLSLELGEPLAVVDVWEHAYYLDYQNRRADFVTAVIDHCLKW